MAAVEYIVKVTERLGVIKRSGPAKSFSNNGTAHVNETYTIDQVQQNPDKSIWYKIKGTSLWICALMPSDDNHRYIQIIKDNSPSTVSNNKKQTKTDSNTNTKKSNSSTYVKELRSSQDSDISAYNIDYGKATSGTHRTNIIDVTYGDLNKVCKITTGDACTNSEFQTAMKNVKKNVNANYFKSLYELENTLHNKYNLFQVKFPDYGLHKAFPRVFFTRPDLNLFDTKDGIAGSDISKLKSDISLDPLYFEIFNKDKKMIQCLSSEFSHTNDLNLYLSNAVRSIDIPDEAIGSEEVGENAMGYKVMYGKSNVSSLVAGTFNCTLEESGHLSIHRMLTAWTQYISDVYLGKYAPKKQYILDKTIDYACSCYYFLCAGDGETILYGHKFYGVFPMNVPSSSLSWNQGSVVSDLHYNVQFGYSFREPVSVMNFVELNNNTIYKQNGVTKNPGVREARALYNNQLGHSGNTFVGVPFIVAENKNGHTVYKLKFKTS